MKEVKVAKERQQQLILETAERLMRYQELLDTYTKGGDEMVEKQVTFQRAELYREIWAISLSKVAAKYQVPASKLKEACEKANIPLPTNKYWGDLSVGKPVTPIPLPDSSLTELTVVFKVREKEHQSQAEKMPTKESLPDVRAQATPQLPKHRDGKNLYERGILYKEVWEQPVTKVAEKYGVSDVMIHKVCKALNIPVPPRGYWAKKQAGQAVEITPLPESNGKSAILGSKSVSSSDTQKLPPNEELSFLDEIERSTVVAVSWNLHVNNDGHKLHPMLLKHKASFAAWKKQHPRDEFAPHKRDSYYKPPEGEPPLWDDVSEDILPRVYLILDALFRTVEALGGSVNQNLSLQIRGENVFYRITEGKTQATHALTKDEQKQWEKYEKEKRLSHYALEPKFRKYDYIPNGKLTFAARRDSYLRDTDNIGLEGRLGEILLDLYIESENVRIKREEREAAQRKAAEEQRQKELRRQRWDEEVDKLQALENEAADFERACRIRAYVAAVGSKSELTEEESAWIQWANAKADWLDPTVAAKDQIFGNRGHGKSEESKAPKKSGRYWW